MAAFLFLLISAALYAGVGAQQSPLNISLGSSLTPIGNSSWLSRSGVYAFGFYQLGNGYSVGIFLAEIPEKTVVWTANREIPIFSSNVSLVLSSDGRLILQLVEGQEITTANPDDSISSVSMLDSGNFVLYNSAQKIMWQSFENPTNTLLPGQRFIAGQELISSASETDDSRGIFRLKMQDDGNLVQYSVDTPDTEPHAYYATNTGGSGSDVSLNLDDDGHLYLINSGFKIIHNLTDGGYPKDKIINLMKIDVDGIFRLYSVSLDQGNRSILWSSTNDKCAPKGLCGFNGFCVNIQNSANCRCLPGFDFVNQSNWTLGCERNFTAESCKTEHGSVKYTIRLVDNTEWEDVPYAITGTITKQDCEKACLEDCNCEAAFFLDGKCRKQRLPLKYGRRSISSSIVLVKVGILGSVNEDAIPTPSNVPKKCTKEVRSSILIIGISLAVSSVLISVIAGVYVHRNKIRAFKKVSQKIDVESVEDVSPRAFTFAELEEATDSFKEELGRGAFGTVYKGILPNSQKLMAVKRLEKVLADGEKEFQNEIKVIGKTHHINLVRLLGYCFDGSKRLLVYEYMSNGSLADVLFTPEKKLSWDERIKIARDIARGILYLHEECETQIIHCDIKPQNILMDDNKRAKISDFGLAKLLNHDQTRTFTGIRGTRGYVALEWYRKLPVTVKADIYSFGIVLLEIICCRRSVDCSFPEDEAILEDWVRDCFQAREFNKLVVDEEIDMKELEVMIKIALLCIQDEPALRPAVNEILLMLQGIVEIPVPPSPISFLSSNST